MDSLSRRRFIAAVSLISGAFAVPACVVQGESGEGAEGKEEGELYAGLILLKDGAPTPAFVRLPMREMPIMCGTGVGRGGPEPTGVHVAFDSASELARAVPYQLVAPNATSTGFETEGGDLILYPGGEVFASNITFLRKSAVSKAVEIRAHLCSYPNHPAPFPIWSVEPVEPNGPSAPLEKVTFLPVPGVMQRSRNGYLFHWIKDDVLHILTIENEASPVEAPALDDVVSWIQSMDIVGG